MEGTVAQKGHACKLKLGLLANILLQMKIQNRKLKYYCKFKKYITEHKKIELKITTHY